MSNSRRDELEGREDLAPDDPRFQSLGPKTRAHLRAYRDFVVPGEMPAGARLDEAEQRLGETLARELGVAIEGDAPRAAPAGARAAEAAHGVRGLLAALLGPRLRPALAIAALVIVAGGVWLSTAGRRGADAPVMRGTEDAPAGAALTTTTRMLPGGGVRLEWTPTPEADGYALEFLSPDLVAVAQVTGVREPRFELRSGSLPAGLSSGGRVLWRVLALRGADEVARSKATAITLP